MSATKLLICSSGLGAGTKGAELGPFALLIACEELGLPLLLDKTMEVLENDYRVYLNSNKYAIEYQEKILGFNQQVCAAVAASFPHTEKLICCTGDHSNAIGTISGLRRAFPQSRIGVVWIDAHADLHNPFTSPSLNMHGMPLAALTGIKQAPTTHALEDRVRLWNQMIGLGGPSDQPKIGLNDIVFIGIRDLEPAEWDLVHQHQIPHFTPAHIDQMGMEALAGKTIELLADKDVIYVSFDVDSLDPSISKGTGTPVANGLSLDQASVILSALYHDNRCRLLEITEINPLLDQENNTAKKVASLLHLAGIS
ncbi:MAG: arginase [Bacteroidetes bacterium]|jgi:arginase|nr:arginase [Bacteroidota bacterium]